MTFLEEKLQIPVYGGKKLEFLAQGGFCNLVLQNALLNSLMKHIHHGKKQGTFT